MARGRMGAVLARWKAHEDRRALFLRTWMHCLDAAFTAVRNDSFASPIWVMQLLDGLAEYYLLTVEVDVDDLSRVTPPAWRAAHSAAGSLSATRRDTLFLGVNAVINNDLPQAIGDALLAGWPMSNVSFERHHQDVGMLLDIIADVIDPAGDAVISCQAESTASGCSSALGQLIDAWRDEAWENAVLLVTASDDRWRDVIREGIELTALRRAHLVMCDITARSHLLALPSHRLDYVFPARHQSDSCRLPVALPRFGGAAAMTGS
jgi:Family of unknown function (DUF5995)